MNRRGFGAANTSSFEAGSLDVGITITSTSAKTWATALLSFARARCAWT